jgi:hypothetical protein
MKKGVSLRFILTLQLKKMIRNCNKLYVVMTINKNKDIVSIKQYPMLLEFSDMFPKELPKLPPKRELKFITELKWRMKPITKAPYLMTTPQL